MRLDHGKLAGILKSLENLKEPIITTEPDYMEQCKVNGDINTAISILEKLTNIKYGCYCDCDFDENDKPIPDPQCVMDEDCKGYNYHDCIYATEFGNKRDCNQWKIVL